MYKKGPSNVHADALSRLRTNAETIADDWDEIPCFITEGDISDVTDEEDNQDNGIPTKLRFKQRYNAYSTTCQEEEL